MSAYFLVACAWCAGAGQVSFVEREGLCQSCWVFYLRYGELPACWLCRRSKVICPWCSGEGWVPVARAPLSLPKGE